MSHPSKFYPGYDTKARQIVRLQSWILRNVEYSFYCNYQISSNCYDPIYE